MKHVISLSFARIGYFFSEQHVKIRAVRDTAAVSMLRHRYRWEARRICSTQCKRGTLAVFPYVN